MKVRGVAIGLVVLSAAAAVLLAWARWRRPEGPVLSGALEARDVQVGSLLGGRVAAVHVDEGARVVKGQPLVTFETDLVDLQLREQEARVAEARATLERVLAGPRAEERERARLEWQSAERERRRLEALLQEGIVGRQQYDQAVTRATTAQELLRQLERGSRPEEIAAARAAVEREKARRRYLARQREEAVVRAPADGTLETFDLRPGDLVPANRPVAALLEDGQLWVRVYVPEPRLGLVRLGQAAAVRVDSFPDRRFPGRVVEIGDRAEYTPRNVQTIEQRADQVFAVKVSLQPAAELKAGMAALVELSP